MDVYNNTKMKIMRQTILYRSLIVLIVLISAYSCNKSDIMTFDPKDNAVNFPDGKLISSMGFDRSEYDAAKDLLRVSFSFLDSIGKNEVQLKIPVVVMGKTAPIDRTVNFKVIKLELDEFETNAVEGVNYDIVESKILANENYGYIIINVKNSEELSTEDMILNIELSSSEDLKKGAVEYSKCKILWNNKLIKPTHSHQYYSYNMLIHSTVPELSPKADAYSENGQKVIMKVLECSEIPKFSAPPYYLYKGAAGGNAAAYASRIDKYLEEWDKENPENPWIHESGVMKGQKICARGHAK